MVYRAQVAGAVDAPPDEPASSSGWRAEDSLARVAGARAITWRRERGYEKDEDFAFAFSTWEEAGWQSVLPSRRNFFLQLLV